MSQENVSAVLGGMEAAQREGRIVAQALPFDPDVEWDISTHPLPDFPDKGRGREALVEHLTRYFSGWSDYESGVSEVFDAEDDVVVILRERARVPRSDRILERDLPQVWTIKNGRCHRFRVFRTTSEALKAAGLEG